MGLPSFLSRPCLMEEPEKCLGFSILRRLAFNVVVYFPTLLGLHNRKTLVSMVWSRKTTPGTPVPSWVFIKSNRNPFSFYSSSMRLPIIMMLNVIFKRIMLNRLAKINNGRVNSSGRSTSHMRLTIQKTPLRWQMTRVFKWFFILFSDFCYSSLIRVDFV